MFFRCTLVCRGRGTACCWSSYLDLLLPTFLDVHHIQLTSNKNLIQIHSLIFGSLKLDLSFFHSLSGCLIFHQFFIPLFFIFSASSGGQILTPTAVGRPLPRRRGRRPLRRQAALGRTGGGPAGPLADRVDLSKKLDLTGQKKTKI